LHVYTKLTTNQPHNQLYWSFGVFHRNIKSSNNKGQGVFPDSLGSQEIIVPGL